MNRNKYLGPFLIALLCGCFIMLGKIGALDIQRGWIAYDHPIDFPQLSEKSELALVFFGYTQCESVCPITLALLEDVYQKYKTGPDSKYNPLKVVMIDLSGDPNITAYVRQFHPDFIGLTMVEPQLSKLLYTFNATMRITDKKPQRAPLNKSAPPIQIEHSGAVYLIAKKKQHWRLKRRYIDNPIIPQIIIKDLRSTHDSDILF